jgi:FAD/FMN-containing dehydrogenase
MGVPAHTLRGPAVPAKDKTAVSNKLEDVPWIETASAEYESKRKTYNLDNTSSPSAIACPRHAQDVAALVRYAIESNLPITVRSGGHDIFGRSIVQSALCIDMRAIDFVEIAPDRKSAKIGGGILTGKLIEVLSKEGLATPFGSVPSVGYFGWASLGGYGALSGQWGLGVDQIIGAEVVDANGEVIQADEEMLKGIRGAGGNFGIVVGLQIKLCELKTVRMSSYPRFTL